MPADLGRIVGGMLAGVAEARSLADRYSRGLAIDYERDDLLRLFPVPRTEISDVSVELHFAVDAVEGSAPPRATEVIDQTVRQLSQAVSAAIAKVKVRRAPSTVQRQVGDAVRTELINAAAIAGALPDGAAASSFDPQRVSAAVLGALQGGIGVKPEVQAAVREAVASVAPAHVQAIGDVRAAGAFTGLLLSVRVTHEELATLPAQAISVARFNLAIRNYEWTQVDERDGEPVRKLVPE